MPFHNHLEERSSPPATTNTPDHFLGSTCTFVSTSSSIAPSVIVLVSSTKLRADSDLLIPDIGATSSTVCPSSHITGLTPFIW